MKPDFQQVAWDDALVDDLRALVRLALAEDLGAEGDVTSRAIVDPARRGEAALVARQDGVVAGAMVPSVVLAEAGADAEWLPALADGDRLAAGAVVGVLRGAALDLLRCERINLNLMSRLTGVATLTARFVEQIAGSGAEVYDTRKTTPGWRRIEKFAVRCGGGRNHRLGLFDAVLIKDNHLALAVRAGLTPADAVRLAREKDPGRIVEVEVDTLDQLSNVLPVEPDVVLLDNMTPDQLTECVERRNAGAAGVVLEASGGVRLGTIAAIAATGVDRISVGAMTHAAISIDLGLDWR